MPLRFPQAEHLPLSNPPLTEVVCQIRFPPILRIAEETPSKFQEMIRTRFPIFKTEHGLEIQFSPGQPIKPLGQRPPVHRFLDKDEIRTVSLGFDFFAISTTHYESWQSFADDLYFIAEAVLTEYKVPFSTRIGLRYINALNVENTKTKTFDPDVLKILKTELTCLLTTEEIQSPRLALTQIRARQDDDGEFSFRTGIVQQPEEDGELSFLLDFDRYYDEKLELDIDGLLERCERYHAEIYNAFRWSIVENKLQVFDPKENSGDVS